MPFLTFPLALAALTALPTLAAIYWLRNKHRRIVVSSLMLFLERQRPREGGMRMERSGLPPLFYLELLALLLLALAAADPQFRLSREERPLVVVLDDSFTMLAGGADSPRKLAEAKLVSILAENAGEPTRLVLAGREPSMLGEVFRTPADARPLMESWTCRAPAADLVRAMAMARETGGPFARILVLTDAPAPESLATSDRMRWLSFGQPRSNLAVVNASRIVYENKHRILLEIGNFSDLGVGTRLRVDYSSNGVEPSETSVLDLAPHELKRIVFEVPATKSTMTVSLPDDLLPIDNVVVLPPPAERLVALREQVTGRELKSLVHNAVEAAGLSEKAATNPDLIITDGSEADALVPAGSDTWIVRFLAGRESQSYLGPFVLDRTHPLTQGLSLDGVIWSGDAATTQPTTQSSAAPGAPSAATQADSPSDTASPNDTDGVILAGNVPLLTDTLHLGGTHTVTFHFRPDLSTLQQTPGWPVLIWNLLRWRSLELPGPSRSLVRLGEPLDITLPRGSVSLRLLDPLGRTREFRSANRKVTVPCDVVGQYRIEAGSEQYGFAVAPLNPEGSNLLHKATGEWGQWKEQGESRSAYRAVGWALALVALLVLSTHAYLVFRGGARPNE